MPTTFDVTDLVSQYGDYYEKTAANKNRIKGELFQPAETLAQIATPIKTDDTVYKMANTIFSSLIKPFDKAFSAGGGVEFVANKIELFKQKIDFSVYPDDIEGMWLGFLAGKTAQEKKEWPIIRWLMEEYLIPQTNEDKETAVWAGERDDDGTSATDCYDGLLKQLKAGVANTDYPITSIADVGALVATTAFDQIETFSKAIPSLYTNKRMYYVMSPAMVRAYLEGKRDAGYYQITKDDDLGIRVDFTNHVLIGSPSMAGSTGIFATLPGNLLHLTKRGADQGNFSVQQDKREVCIMTDWWEGFGFACNALVWTTAETVAENEDENENEVEEPVV